MRDTPERHRSAADRTVKDIRRKTRKRYSSEDKIRIVLAGLRGEDRNGLCQTNKDFEEDREREETTVGHLNRPYKYLHQDIRRKTYGAL